MRRVGRRMNFTSNTSTGVKGRGFNVLCVCWGGIWIGGCLYFVDSLKGVYREGSVTDCHGGAGGTE